MNENTLALLKKRGHNIVNADCPLEVDSVDLIAIKIKGEIHLFGLTEYWVVEENGRQTGEVKFKQVLSNKRVLI